MSELFVKRVIQDKVAEELVNIDFDKSYIAHAAKKNRYTTLKVCGLRPQEASILKQSALALGFDAAVNRGVLDCSVESSDALLTGSVVQFERLASSLSRQPFKMKTVANLILSEIGEKPAPIKFNNFVLAPDKSHLMGILNITPDSFSDGGKYDNVEKACEHFLSLRRDGADIIDIGAESTRPNHTPIAVEEEIKRLVPVLKAVRELNKNTPISVDTRNVKNAEIALELGANIINDVGFGEYDKDMINFINSADIPYVLTHSLDITREKDATNKVYHDLLKKLEKITAPVIIDVGLGFGKTAEQNFELIKRISEFKSLKKHLLVGHSRKSFLRDEFDAELGTAAVSCQLMSAGVEILRVHDVKAHKAMLEVYNRLN